MTLTPRIVHFLVVPIGGPSVLAPARCLLVALLILRIVLLAFFLGLLLGPGSGTDLSGVRALRLASW